MATLNRVALLTKVSSLTKYTTSDNDVVYLRQWSGRDLSILQSCAESERLACVIALSLAEEDGRPVFTLDEYDVILSLPIKLLNEIALEALRMNGVNLPAQEIRGN